MPTEFWFIKTNNELILNCLREFDSESYKKHLVGNMTREQLNKNVIDIFDFSNPHLITTNN